MIAETRDYDTINPLMELHRDIVGDFDLQKWLDDDRNLAFVDDKGNIGLLEYDRDKLYNSHLFFHSRGRDAILRAKAMILNAFDNYPVLVMRGYTPLTNRAARWVDRQLGFTSYGKIHMNGTPDCELFLLTKQEFEDKHGRTLRRLFA